MESKVGATRRSLFVPVPKAWTLDGSDADLFERCMGMADKPRYRKGDREADLFERDRAALLPLPDTPMDVVTYKRMKADKYGIVVLERRHRYLAGPGHAGREPVVGLRAGSVEILDGEGTSIAVHERAYGDRPTSSEDPLARLETLRARANAWRNSRVRDALPDALASWLDTQGRIELQGHLRTLLSVSRDSGWDNAVRAMNDVFAATGGIAPAGVGPRPRASPAGRSPSNTTSPSDRSGYDIVFDLATEEGASS